MKVGRITSLIVALLGAAWAGLDMIRRTDQEMLWGWRPLLLMAASWAVVLMLVVWRSKIPSTRVRYVVLSTLSGVLLAAGFPPSVLTPLVFIGFVPLLILEREIAESSGGTSRKLIFLYAFNAFFIWNFATTWWVINTSFLPGIVANSLNAVFMATVFTAFHQANVKLSGTLRPLAFIAFWISFEYLHLFWELSWPWLNLGHYFAKFPSWVQWYEFTGVFGGALWVLAVNYLIWKLYDQRLRIGRVPGRQAAMIGGMILLPIAIGVSMFYTYDSEPDSVEVAVIQPNFEPHYQKFRVPPKDQLQQFIELSEQVVGPETKYLVMPETSFGSVRLGQIEFNQNIRAFREFALEHPGLNVVVGLESLRFHDSETGLSTIRTYYTGRDTIYYDVQNSAVQISGEIPVDPYFKSKLVPGAEFFPFRKVLPFIKPLIGMLQGSVEGLTMQDERQVFSSSTADVAPIICYESIYGAYVGEYLHKGADLLFIITNDGWWDKTPGHIQHLQIGALRAIEHRRAIARSANTGISCFISPRGEILQPTEYGVDAAIKATLPIETKSTIYTRWGDIIARISTFLTIVLLALTIVRTAMPADEDEGLKVEGLKE